ncbi:antistasin-like [Gordionus sp. m RMFG-2023]|uniref:antistasin-like n=1 Tax=Gordionus sp. m RMFG-2023 TaxID=3053472 RepID=UPI0031FCDD80
MIGMEMAVPENKTKSTSKEIEYIRLPPSLTTNITKCRPMCRKFCPHGYVTDSDGCPSCECRPDPADCPGSCLLFCTYGNELDKYGCPACTCKSEPDAKDDKDGVNKMVNKIKVLSATQ